MYFKKLLIIGLLAPLLASCVQGVGEKQTIGTLIGAAGGGLAGAQIGKGRGQLAATAVGALLGAMVGSEIGKSLDQADRMYMAQTRHKALDTVQSGQSSKWVNPDSGNSGTVIPQPAFEQNPGQYCREFQETVSIGGQEETAYGTACRQPDGTWKIVN